MNRRGITLWEIGLFTVFLAVAVGASVFFFFLNSEDFKKAQQKYEWVKNINQTLDEVTLELANAVVVEYPFAGTSKDCFFRASMNSGNLLPSIVQEGFTFSGNSLKYVSRNASTTTGLRRLGRYANPLVGNCRDGKFARTAPDIIEISFKAAAPDDSGQVKEFRRVVNLRNL
ncbi:MAG: hypothetical protein Kow0029_31490 [Candidatus Rifleibacteriota bacterium]